MNEKQNLNDLPSTPWKNGGGITRELLRLPKDSTLDSFALRVSVADVDTDAPFSMFPGVDRTLLILRGAGLDLVDGSTNTVWKTLEPGLSPLQFEGMKPLVGCLTDGPIRDFNLMVRRSAAKGDLKIAKGPSTTSLLDCCCVFMARGQALIMQGDAVWATLLEFDFSAPPRDAYLVIEQDAVALVVNATVF